MTKDKFQREERYIVFKMSDVEEHFTPDEKRHLERLVEVQRAGREEVCKSPLDCVVVESDWPEYEPTWRAIEARVTGAQPSPSINPASLYAVINWLRNGCDPRKAADELEMFAATLEAKP